MRNYEFLNSFYSEMGGRMGEVSLQAVPKGHGQFTVDEKNLEFYKKKALKQSPKINMQHCKLSNFNFFAYNCENTFSCAVKCRPLLSVFHPVLWTLAKKYLAK